MTKIDTLLKDLCEYKRLAELANQAFEAEKLKVITYLEENGLDEIIGIEHKISYKLVTSLRFDNSSFKKDHADLYNKYRKETTTRRFTVA